MDTDTESDTKKKPAAKKPAKKTAAKEPEIKRASIRITLKRDDSNERYKRIQELQKEAECCTVEVKRRRLMAQLSELIVEEVHAEAEDGDVTKMIQLSKWYATGFLVDKDPKEADEWMSRAVTAGATLEEMTDDSCIPDFLKEGNGDDDGDIEDDFPHPFTQRITVDEMDDGYDDEEDFPEDLFDDPETATPEAIEANARTILDAVQVRCDSDDMEEQEGDRLMAFRLRRLAKVPAYAAEALAGLSYCYAGGYGVREVSGSNMFRCLTQSAEQGFVGAMVSLSEMYEVGDFVEVSPEKSVEWAEKAAATGKVEGLLRLVHVYMDGDLVDVNPTKAFRLLKTAVKTGHPAAQMLLGVHFLYGLGTKPDRAKGLRFLKRAAESGDSTAKDYYCKAKAGIEIMF